MPKARVIVSAYGQVGGEVADRAFSPALVPGTEEAVAVATGARHSCALLDDRQVRCWGELIDEATNLRWTFLRRRSRLQRVVLGSERRGPTR
jgi:hypothetical protein